MTKHELTRTAAAAILVAFPVFGADPQVFPLTAATLEPHRVKIETVDYKGRKAIRLVKDAQGDGMALLKDTEFGDGSIEVDVAVKVTSPPGVRNPGFIGIAFRSRSDASHYDMFYIRPGNAHAADQAMRNHALQYVASPGYDWEILRRKWPFVYETYADLQLETWIPLRIEVQGRHASLYVNGAANPSLVVDGLKGENLKGGIGLWPSPGQESYFSNLRIHHATPAPLANGGEANGAWELRYTSDAGPHTFQLQLTRDGAKVSGTISGAGTGSPFDLLRGDRPLTGTWRNGYLELSFAAIGREPGSETIANLAGWIDGDSAKGRMIVNGRADGVWTATRKP